MGASMLAISRRAVIIRSSAAALQPDRVDQVIHGAGPISEPAERGGGSVNHIVFVEISWAGHQDRVLWNDWSRTIAGDDAAVRYARNRLTKTAYRNVKAFVPIR